MTGILDVRPNDLIGRVAEDLEKKKVIEPPEWSKFVKTGVHKERPPSQENWWYLRAGALMRKLYKQGPIGISRLRGLYGGAKNRGHKTEHHYKAGGKVIRSILMQLEEKGFVRKDEKGGRALTANGVKYLTMAVKELNTKEKKQVAI